MKYSTDKAVCGRFIVTIYEAIVSCVATLVKGFDNTYSNLCRHVGYFQRALRQDFVMPFPSWASTLTKVEVSYSSLVLLLRLFLPHHVTATIHDDSFTPDAILRVTSQVFSLGGIQKLTTLVNGSIPGPELRVPENETACIRVFNDMKGQNLTMVSRIIIQIVPSLWS